MLQLLKQLAQEIFMTGKKFQIGMALNDAVVMACHLIVQALLFNMQLLSLPMMRLFKWMIFLLKDLVTFI